ncbi:Centrosomin N-terminal motif 1 [Popillia japonica]|uniref:Centrosomin N-terminal motif 1 n=1 Tax=Popillia japonica TaxID=7064 RepID=A0AAW1N2M4_POPJA
MSSFFNTSGVQSPPRRPIIQPSAISPFGTSPSQLQEVTLDPDGSYSYTMGLHSSNGGGPFRGRSIKEMDELTTNLRKENFNLKLRIYFLEERMGTNFNLDKENAIKKNIELKVEVESLKKELIEKQDLLCQAVKAMELDEEEHKKEVADKDKEIIKLQSQLDSLQHKYDLFQDEMRCQGDSGMNDPFGMKKQDSAMEFHLNELENKVKDLEMQLEKERENNRELENLLQLSENRKATISSLESELKRKDETYKKLGSELEERNKIIENFHVRISALEEDIAERQREVEYLKKDLDEKSNQIQELQSETEEFHKIASETRALYEAERRKGERHKTSIMHRNAKIVELENVLEKTRAKVMNLETRLEAAHNEVKMHGKTTDADLSPKKESSLSKLKKSPSASSSEQLLALTPTGHNNTSGNTTGTPSTETPNKTVDQLQYDISKSKKHIAKLEQDQLKACRIIQSMLDKQKKNEGKIKDLQGLLVRKDSQIEELSERLDKFNKNAEVSGSAGAVVPTADRVNRELNTSQHMNPLGDNENSMAEANEDPRLLLEQYKELTDSLEEQKKVLMCTLEETKFQMNELESKYHSLQDDLKTKENRIVDLEFELLSLSQDVTNDMSMSEKSDVGNEKPSNFFIKEIEDKDREIERLENELRKRTCDLQGIVNKELWEKNREIEKLQKRYGDIICNKDTEIAKLEQNLAGRNEQLEILKDTISELGLDIKSLANSNDILVTKEGVKEMEEKLKAAIKERDYFRDELNKQAKITMEMNILEKEHIALQQELEQCQRLRSETNEVCAILTNRLEELAYFLDSLLKQKAILGFLGQVHNEKLRQLINQSLDISRTLTHSLTMDPENSLLQLSNLTNILNVSRNDSILAENNFRPAEEENTVLSVVPANVSLTYQSHLYQIHDQSKSDEQNRIILVLREQIENLKREIELRDTELNKLTVTKVIQDAPRSMFNVLEENFQSYKARKVDEILRNDEEFMEAIVQIEYESRLDDSRRQSPSGEKSMNTSTTLKFRPENHSESESWSEPDRSVSKARIGLDECLKPRKSKFCETSTVSTEGENDKSLSKTSSRKSILAENRQTIIALHEQICELENLVKIKDSELQEAHNLIVLAQNELQDERQKVEDARTCKAEMLERVKQAELRLEVAEVAKKDADNQLAELQKTVSEVKTSQKLLQDTLDNKNKEAYNRINELEIEKSNLLESLKSAKQAATDARCDVETSTKELELMRDEIKKVERTAKEETQKLWEERMRVREQDFEDMMKTLENRAESEIQKLMNSAQELQTKYEAECVKRNEVDKLMATIKELEKVRKVVKVAEDKIHALEESEENLKRQLQESEVDYRNKVNTLRQELEKTNLLYSESLLEKSRILNDKAELDKQLKEFTQKEADFTRQVAHLVHQKSKLEVRISQLEQHNAELKNRLIKMQSGDQMSLSRSAPNSSSRILDLFLNKTCPPSYKRQNSDNSGYNSEDTAVEINNVQKQFCPVMDLVPIDAERQQSNSSPDLGIESDHGRFSSLEMSVNLTRPFLKTLELTESMSNLLNKEEQQLLPCNNEQCCLKTKEIVNENNDLRKRLLRTRRALEETVSQLTLANQRKKQVEKTICKQIHKTSQVLRKAKANLDSGSENDAVQNVQ